MAPDDPPGHFRKRMQVSQLQLKTTLRRWTSLNKKVVTYAQEVMNAKLRAQYLRLDSWGALSVSESAKYRVEGKFMEEVIGAHKRLEGVVRELMQTHGEMRVAVDRLRRECDLLLRVHGPACVKDLQVFRVYTPEKLVAAAESLVPMYAREVTVKTMIAHHLSVDGDTGEVGNDDYLNTLLMEPYIEEDRVAEVRSWFDAEFSDSSSDF